MIRENDNVKEQNHKWKCAISLFWTICDPNEHVNGMIVVISMTTAINQTALFNYCLNGPV